MNDQHCHWCRRDSFRPLGDWQEKVRGTDGRTETAVKKMGVPSGRGFTVFTVILAERSPSARAVIGIVVISRMRIDGNIIIVIISITQKSTRLEKENWALLPSATSDSAQRTGDVVGGVMSI